MTGSNRFDIQYGGLNGKVDTFDSLASRQSIIKMNENSVVGEKRTSKFSPGKRSIGISLSSREYPLDEKEKGINSLPSDNKIRVQAPKTNINMRKSDFSNNEFYKMAIMNKVAKPND